MFGWLKAGPAGPATALAMIGPKTADAVLFVGARNPSAAAETGAVTRLNGRTVVAGEGEASAAATARAAERAGALLEFVDAPPDALPFDAGTFRIVVLPELAQWPAEHRAARLAEAVRVLEPGGRVVAMTGGTGPGLLGRLWPQPSLDEQTVIDLLTRSGLAAARRLAEAEKTCYYEARKAREV
jgi:SAM-dependent methyltransferase